MIDSKFVHITQAVLCQNGSDPKKGMFVSDGASLAGSEVAEAENTGEEALAKLSLTQVTREGDEDTVRRMLELYNKQSISVIDSLDDSKVSTHSPIHHSLCGQVSALHYAARQNSLAIMELLLDHGAEVDNLAAGDLTPLHFAARYKYLMSL